jgi:hypothetical protein
VVDVDDRQAEMVGDVQRRERGGEREQRVGVGGGPQGVVVDETQLGLEDVGDPPQQRKRIVHVTKRLAPLVTFDQLAHAAPMRGDPFHPRVVRERSMLRVSQQPDFVTRADQRPSECDKRLDVTTRSKCHSCQTQNTNFGTFRPSVLYASCESRVPA